MIARNQLQQTQSSHDCKPFASGINITGPRRTGLDETTAGGFVDRTPQNHAGWVQTDGSRVSSSPPSDTRNRWYCNVIGPLAGDLLTVC